MAKEQEPEASNLAANKANVRDGLVSLRAYKRRTVVWPATLLVNEFEFKCMLYDISLGGVRLKLDLPLAAGAQVSIKIKDFEYVEALVSWHADAFVGLKFIDDVETIAAMLGDYADSLQ
ncbi:PilZ domain-containing protein [Pseudemcibacter aquimaris]|uniref:PilZ domain-containing protein n=1 Tax=Pseudemcibacter aquimaris TaxID=2857064 RepID=UPI002013400E|nr:PilZ domain-containing protein [Pseudemcibacter aquimaris]MCC3861380.1 PilZ domain-containing protein [Pseudemcibacter aquimaris]WDU58150.1 PilZ domain-containing protein [Pseudemcibacter aquimaris]